MSGEQSNINLEDAVKARTKEGNQDSLRRSVLISVGVAVIIAVFALASTFTFTPENEEEQAASTNTAPPVAMNDDSAREAFKTLLADFETQHQSLLDNPELRDWTPVAIDNLRDDKNLSLEHFAKGDYQTAQTSLKKVIHDLEEAEANWTAEFEQQMQQAQQAFEQENMPLAQLLLGKAREIKPSSQLIQNLQTRVDAFAEVAEFQRAYEVAVRENNLDKQIQSLQALIAADPAREDARVLLSQAREKAREYSLSQAVREGMAALDREDIESAVQRFREASAIDAKRPAVVTFGQRLSGVLKENDLFAVQNEVESLAQEDSWDAVIHVAQQGLNNHPGDEFLESYVSYGQGVQQAKARLSDYLARPERLKDSRIKQNALLVINEVNQFVDASPSLQQQVETVQAHIEQASFSFPLTILSDNRTYIEVKGKGIVGEVKQKTIMLPSGVYTLVGKRKGYRTKQITVTLPLQENGSGIRLECDERI